MATARINTSVSVTLNSLAKQMAKQFNVTLTGEDYDEGTVTVTTSDAQLSLKSSLATVGWMMVVNTDATNYVNIGKHNSGSGQTYHVRVPADSAVLFYMELAANDISVKANTASCKIHFIAFER